MFISSAMAATTAAGTTVVNTPFFDPTFFNFDPFMMVKIGIFALIGIVGILCHGAVKAMKGEVVSMTAWYTTKKRASMVAFTTLFGAAITAVMSGQMDTMTFTQMCMVAFPVGFTCDSALNSVNTEETTRPLSTKN